jgi:hypothetical protein
MSLLDYSKVKVWKAASVYPVIPILRKNEKNEKGMQVYLATKPNVYKKIQVVPHDLLEKTPNHIWSFVTQKGTDILFKVLELSVQLDSIAEIYGASTVAEGSEYSILLKEQDSKMRVNSNYARFVVSGSIFRYRETWQNIPVHFMRKRYKKPLISLQAPMPNRRIEQALTSKIIICKVALQPRAFLDINGEYAGAYTTYVFKKEISLFYLTAIINSRLTNYIYRTLYNALAMGGGYLRFQPPQIRRIPIYAIDFDNPTEKNQHDKMVKLVEQMLILHQQLNDATSNRKKETIQRQINRTDKRIDKLVYELYDLTPDEIALVEEAC